MGLDNPESPFKLPTRKLCGVPPGPALPGPEMYPVLDCNPASLALNGMYRERQRRQRYSEESIEWCPIDGYAYFPKPPMN
jgi:hypothetical protein